MGQRIVEREATGTREARQGLLRPSGAHQGKTTQAQQGRVVRRSLQQPSENVGGSGVLAILVAGNGVGQIGVGVRISGRREEIPK